MSDAASSAGPLFHATRPSTVHDEHPWSQFQYVNRQLRAGVESFLRSAQLPSAARVLDFGCATKPYAELFPAATDLVGADLIGNPDADCVIDGDGRLDASDATFDAVLSTQVLEHVDSPDVYLSESLRVLKPGGWLLITTHGLMYYHRDPEDYWRWTSDGLRKIVAAHGFEVVRQEGMLALAPAAMQLFQDATCKHLPRRLWRPYVTVWQRAIAWSDARYSDRSRRENSLVIGLLARRPPNVEAS